MGKTVRVTKVTVEYAFEGKTFRVDFPDPDKVATITFSKTDLDRLMKQQAADTNEQVSPRFLKPAQSWPTEVDGAKVVATNTNVGSTSEPNGTSDRALWWHSTACSWFHPEEEDQ